MPARVLVSDDARLMRRIIKDILIEAGYEVAGEASTGTEALEKYKELRPDLVTMDVVMPEMDGIEVVRHILQFDPAARIMMCSALGHDSLIADAIAAGARDYVVKPFKKQKVIEIIKRILS